MKSVKEIKLKRRNLRDCLTYLEKHRHLYPAEIYKIVVEVTKDSYREALDEVKK